MVWVILLFLITGTLLNFNEFKIWTRIMQCLSWVSPKSLMMFPLLLLKEMFIEFTFCYMSKDEAINLLKNTDLAEKRRTL